MIGRRLDPAEVPKFRSICPQTRSSIPPVSRLPIQIPSLHGPGDLSTAVSLRWSKVSTLEKLMGEGAAFSPARLLLKFEETGLGRRQVLNLLSPGWIANLPDGFATVFDSLQHGIVEICREYTLDKDRRTRDPVEGIRKVVMLPDGVCSGLKKCSVYCIDKKGYLGLWSYGDKNWTKLDRDYGGYDDIAVYEGKVFVVNKKGSVWQIVSSIWDPRFFLQIFGGNHGPGSRKYLLVSSGDLYLVEKYIRHGENTSMHDFKVYRLDRRSKKWEEMTSLGNSAFFLFNRCSFAIPALKLGRRHWNCIYYAEEADSVHYSVEVKVFNLANRRSYYLNMLHLKSPVWQME